MKFKIVSISIFLAVFSNEAFCDCNLNLNTGQACDNYSPIEGCSPGGTIGVIVDVDTCYGSCAGGCESNYEEVLVDLTDSCGMEVTLSSCEHVGGNTCTSNSDCSSLNTDWLHGPNNTKTRTIGVCQNGSCESQVETVCEDGGSDSIGTYIYQ